jgi:hypothetical protein
LPPASTGARFDRGAGGAVPLIVTGCVSGKEFMQEGGLRSFPVQPLQPWRLRLSGALWSIRETFVGRFRTVAAVTRVARAQQALPVIGLLGRNSPETSRHRLTALRFGLK